MLDPPEFIAPQNRGGIMKPMDRKRQAVLLMHCEFLVPAWRSLCRVQMHGAVQGEFWEKGLFWKRKKEEKKEKEEKAALHRRTPKAYCLAAPIDLRMTSRIN